MVKLMITNLPEFEAALKEKIIEATGLVLERNIRSLARKDAFDTGSFHASIMFDLAESRLRKAVIVQDGVEYGKFLEFGTIHMAPRAIFQRGLNITLKQMPQILAKI